MTLRTAIRITGTFVVTSIGRKRDFSSWNIALIEIAIAWNYSNHEIQWIFTFSIYRPSRYLHDPAAPMNSIRNPIFCNESIQSSDLMNKIPRVLRDQYAFELGAWIRTVLVTTYF